MLSMLAMKSPGSSMTRFMQKRCRQPLGVAAASEVILRGYTHRNVGLRRRGAA